MGLATTAFGGTLLGVIGYVYQEQANKKLHLWNRLMGGWMQTGHNMKNKFRMARSAFNVLGAASRLHKEMEQGEEGGDTVKHREGIGKESENENENTRRESQDRNEDK